MSSSSESTSSALSSEQLDERGDARPSGRFSDISDFFSSNLSSSDEEFVFAAPVMPDSSIWAVGDNSDGPSDNTDEVADITSIELKISQEVNRMQLLLDCKAQNQMISDDASFDFAKGTTRNILLKVEASVIQHEMKLLKMRGDPACLLQSEQTKMLFDNCDADEWPNLTLSKEETRSLINFYEENPEAQLRFSSKGATDSDQEINTALNLICVDGIYFDANTVNMIVHAQQKSYTEKARTLFFSALKKEAALFLCIGDKKDNASFAETNHQLLSTTFSLILPLETPDRAKKIEECLERIKNNLEEFRYFSLSIL